MSALFWLGHIFGKFWLAKGPETLVRLKANYICMMKIFFSKFHILFLYLDLYENKIKIKQARIITIRGETSWSFDLSCRYIRHYIQRLVQRIGKETIFSDLNRLFGFWCVIIAKIPELNLYSECFKVIADYFSCLYYRGFKQKEY